MGTRREDASERDVDAAVSKLSAYRNLLGYLVLASHDHCAIIRSGGPEFDNRSTANEEKARRMAKFVETTLRTLKPEIQELESVSN